MVYSTQMAYYIVAFGMKNKVPPKEKPYIPELMILKGEDDKLLKVERKAKTELKFTQFLGPLTSEEFEICKPEQWDTGKWLAADLNQISQYRLIEEDNWKKDRIEQLLKELKEYIDPIDKITILTAIANLMEIDLDTLVQSLESKRINLDESLTEIYQRTVNT